ncbi:NAD(P)H-dependent oxidoreductase [Chitinasiproducens palmae]|uniref:NAD(P)H-dependent oxidoreductase n=1 Tax=Chitinasiproducens palmae TaxID=1770053 RepID=UPI000B8918F5
MILTIARGGVYGAGSPIEHRQHAESYLRTVFGFVGVPNVEAIATKGIALGTEQRGQAIAQADARSAALLQWARTYRTRDGSSSFAAHAAIFASFSGDKERLMTREQVSAFAERAGRHRVQTRPERAPASRDA